MKKVITLFFALGLILLTISCEPKQSDFKEKGLMANAQILRVEQIDGKNVVHLSYTDNKGKLQHVKDLKVDGLARDMITPIMYLPNEPHKVMPINAENMAFFTGITARPMQFLDVQRVFELAQHDTIIRYLNKNVAYGWTVKKTGDDAIYFNHITHHALKLVPNEYASLESIGIEHKKKLSDNETTKDVAIPLEIATFKQQIEMFQLKNTQSVDSLDDKFYKSDKYLLYLLSKSSNTALNAEKLILFNNKSRLMRTVVLMNMKDSKNLPVGF